VRSHLIRARAYRILRDTNGSDWEWGRIQFIFHKHQRVLRTLTTAVAEFGNDLLIQEQWDAARECFDFITRLESSDWYPEKVLGDLCLHKKDFDGAISHYRQAANRCRDSKGPASMRNEIHQVEQAERIAKGGALCSLRDLMYGTIRLALSEEAYKRGPTIPKNVRDYGEDLYRCGQCSEALKRFREAHNLMRKQRRTPMGDQNDSLSHRDLPDTDVLAWIWLSIGEAEFRLYEQSKDTRSLTRAKRHLRRLAQRTNDEYRWRKLAQFENRWEDSVGFLVAYERWLESVRGMKENERADIPISHVRSLLKSRFSIFQRKGIGEAKDAAIANRWQAALGFGKHVLRTIDLEATYGMTGAWLLNNHFCEMALECWLNAMRLFNEKIPVASEIRFLSSRRLLNRIRDLCNVVRACGYLQLAAKLDVILEMASIRNLAYSTKSVPDELYDDIQRLVWLEATGQSAAALQLCKELSAEFIQRGETTMHSVCVVADGLLLAGDLVRAKATYQLLCSSAEWPQQFFVACLLRSTAEFDGAALVKSAS
jgi:tetratricopeptide (TPR) repeat protein